MKILQVIAIFQRSAGTSVFCAEAARQLANLGHEVVIAVPDTKADGMYPTPEGVRLESIDAAMKGKWDVVHIHGIWTPILTRVQRWATANNIKLIWSPHGMLQARALMMKWPKKLAGLLVYQWKALKAADVIHVCSDSEARNVARLHLGVPMVKVPLGVRFGDRVDVEGEGEQRSDKREGERFTLLYIGRVNKGKGLTNLVKAWKILGRLCPDVRAKWRVVIAGFDEEGHAAELRRLAKRYKLEEAIEVRGPVYGEEKDKLYAAADLFILPSLSENFGSVILESLIQGVPTIATTGTPWEDLPRIGCGWWVKPNPASLAEALTNAMCKVPEMRREMGEIGRKWVKETFSWPQIGKQVEEMYERAGCE